MEVERNYEQENIYALIQRVKQDDREAFKAITRRYQRKIYMLAFSFFRNSNDAMDIVQETFLRFYQKVDMFQEGRNFQNWLLQIAKNLCVDYYRKNYKKDGEYRSEKRVEEMPIASHNHSDRRLSSDLKEVFAQSLAKLTERQRMIFVMKHYNQFSYVEIAQILGIAVGTVKSINFKALKNLKILMTPYVGEKL
jgi:RNA polymerase sigma-70 factor (ECF subfamily)